MRTLLFILVSFIAFSCKTNHYISDPIDGYPTNGLQTNVNSNGILVASNYNLKTDTAYFGVCLKGLRLNVEAKSEIKIIDEIFFLKRPDTAILTELKAKYNADGLLLLTKLRIQKRCFDVPSGKFAYMDNRMPEPYFEITKTNIPWTNLIVKIISQWEYHDFTTGKSFKPSAKS